MNKKISTPLAISIIAVLAVLVGGGLLGYMYYSSKQISEIPQIEIKNETAGWKTYINSEYNFSFKYPNEQIISSCDNNDNDISQLDRVCMYFSDYDRYNEQPWMQVQAYKSSEESLQEVASTYTVNTKKNIKIDGVEALELPGKCGGGACSVHWITIKNGFVYDISGVYYSGNNLYNKLLDKYYRIVSTFKFIEKDETSDWKTYKNDEYGFEFKYPSNWVIDNRAVSQQARDELKLKQYIGLEPTDKIYYLEGAQVSPFVMEIFDKPLDEYLNKISEKEKSVNDNGVPIREVRVTSTYYTHSFFVDLSENYQKGFFVISNSFNEPELENILTQLISSFNFISPVSVIDSITPNSGPVGTTIEIKGKNFNGFEGDLIAWIENSKGEKGILYSIDQLAGNRVPGESTLIRTKIESKLCTTDNSYSGLPCSKYLDIVPGVYKIYTMPWGNKSNEVQFTVTP